MLSSSGSIDVCSVVLCQIIAQYSPGGLSLCLKAVRSRVCVRWDLLQRDEGENAQTVQHAV